MKVNVLGTDYEIIKRAYEEEPRFKEENIDGFENYHSKQIVLLDLDKSEKWLKETKEVRDITTKEMLRHEIIHAFLDESGLQYSAHESGGAWPVNEEMIDWIALQAPKMLKAFQEADCI